MKPNMKETTNSEKSTELGLLSGLINQHILENSTTTTFMVKVFTHGLTGVSMKENGELTKCMAKELSVGQMVGSISVNMQKTRKEATENSFGLIDDVTEVNG